ncbi:MAG: DHHA1 domain-containing protein [Oscillospiraceae bacterium]
MLMTGENRTIVARGLSHIADSDFIGLRALLAGDGPAAKGDHLRADRLCPGPRINAAGRMGEADRAADLMLCKDPIRAQALARGAVRPESPAPGRGAGDLCPGHRHDRSRARPGAPRLGPGGPPVAPGCGGHRGLPSQREIRLPQLHDPHFRPHRQRLLPQLGGFNLFAALEECSDLLLGFGGHELAAGFTIEEENIPAFRARMNQCVLRFMDGRPATLRPGCGCGCCAARSW